jgi:biopolymer transport protein ExbD
MAGFGTSQEDDVFSSINVTPLVDVVLVLLIIFMITAPAIYQSSIQVQLPKATSGDTQEKPPLQFTISKQGVLTWNQEKIDWKALSHKLSEEKAQSRLQTEKPVMISADDQTPHGTVIRLMDLLKQAGLNRFAISVQQIDL